MPIHVIADSQRRFSDLRPLLEPRYAVHYAALGSGEIGSRECDAVIVAADLRQADSIAALKLLFPKLKHARCRIFITDQKERLFAVQAYALGATHVMASPVNQRSLLIALADGEPPPAASATGENSSRQAASNGAAAIASMFASALSGEPLDVAAAKAAAGGIADCIAETGLANWLETVRRHHEGTYQHCLLVTGVAVDFGLHLGLARGDIERLHSAAMFHDIGKARIPLRVLDKPGRLDPQERALIETHAIAGYEILKDNSGISYEILDAVRHHHEYLDGSGYPDGLCADRIADIVRILTIADVFAALIEQRSYKSSMSREQAYEIMRGMAGKLEAPLLSSFREVALNR